MNRNVHVCVHIAELDLDAAKLFLHAVEDMAGEGAGSNKPAVILLALELVARQATRARAILGRLS